MTRTASNQLRRRPLKPTEPALVAIARFDGMFGVRGELKCRLSSAGEGIVEDGAVLWLDPERREAVTIEGVRRHQGRLLVAVRGVTGEAAARSLVGRRLFATREQIELAPGEFLDEDLIGMHLLSTSGEMLGEVRAVEHFPAQDCLVVGPRKALVPLVSAFIQRVDPQRREIHVSLPPGLLDPALAEEA